MVVLGAKYRSLFAEVQSPTRNLIETILKIGGRNEKDFEEAEKPEGSVIWKLSHTRTMITALQQISFHIRQKWICIHLP